MNSTLRIHGVAVSVAKQVQAHTASIAKHDADLARQIRRAMVSVVLNIAEGANRRGGNGRVRFESAMGSANEVAAALEVGEALGYVEGTEAARDGLDRVARTMAVLMR